jgi:hypothetical protein
MSSGARGVFQAVKSRPEKSLMRFCKCSLSKTVCRPCDLAKARGAQGIEAEIPQTRHRAGREFAFANSLLAHASWAGRGIGWSQFCCAKLLLAMQPGADSPVFCGLPQKMRYNDWKKVNAGALGCFERLRGYRFFGEGGQSKKTGDRPPENEITDTLPERVPAF